MTNFDMVKFNMYGKLTWHVKWAGSLVNCVVLYEHMFNFAFRSMFNIDADVSTEIKRLYTNFFIFRFNGSMSISL